jgi:hypothetical protein
MAKPFSIQSPEDIAKEYAGNKQKIAQAMQMGVVDPTAGVLAGMFIDRMRSAQAQEGVPQATVAQQVMGGAPPVPAPPLPAGGLGATSQAAPPMTPEMGMAPPMPAMPAPQEAPMGMADGGLAMLPVPDAMFDEPTNGGYSGGGIVAFSDGGDIDLERLRRAILMQESGGDYGVMNREGSGAMGAYQFMPDTARALAKRAGVEYRPDLMSGKGGRSKEGIAYQERLMDEQMKDILAFSGGDVGRAGIYHFAGPNEKGHGPKTRQYGQDILRRYSGSKDSGEMPERDVQSAEGRRRLSDDQLALAQERFAALPEGGLGELEAYYRGELDPKAQREERKQDMWMALTQLGANMAASKSPFFLQAAGEAIASALPGVAASKKERKEAERDARKGLREVLGLARDEQKEVLNYAQEREIAELGAEIGGIERAERRAEAEEERKFRSREATLGHTRALKEIEAQGAVANSQFEQMVAARRQQIKDRLAQGLPVTNPDGKVVANNKGTLASSEIEVLAQLWAEYDRQRYKPSAQSGGIENALRPGGGVGGGQQEVVTVLWTQ